MERKNDNNDKNKHGKEINLILAKNSNSNKIPKSTKMLIRDISERKSIEGLFMIRLFCWNWKHFAESIVEKDKS